MQHNQLPFQSDIKSILYSNFSLSSLTNLLMRISKTEMAQVTSYLERCLKNPVMFFNLLTRELNASKPFDAMRLLHIYNNRYGNNDSFIKHALEVDTKLITFLFEKYKDDGRALSVVANAISRIACPDKLRDLWKTQGLNSAYYSLVTNKVTEIKLELLLESLNEIDSVPITKFIQFLSYTHGASNEEISKRDWSLNECYPLNMSGITIVNDEESSNVSVKVVRAYINENLLSYLMSDLTCAVIQNMSYASIDTHPSTQNRDLFGVNFNIQHDSIKSLGFSGCDLRYASLMRCFNNENTDKVKLQLINCQLEHAVISGLMIDLNNFLFNTLNHAYLTDCKLNVITNKPSDSSGKIVNQSKFPEIFDLNYQGRLIRHSIDSNSLLTNILETNMKGMVLTNMRTGISNRTAFDPVDLFNISFTAITKIIAKSAEQISDIDQLARLLTGLNNNHNLFRLNLRGVFNPDHRKLSTSDFTSNTNAWIQIISILKQRIITLIKNYSVTPFQQLSSESVRVLERLNVESGRLGFFDRIDTLFSEIYLQYQSPVVVNRNLNGKK